MITEMGRPRRIHDTPCARCGHPHDGSDQFYAGNTRVFIERCGVWLGVWSLARVELGPCVCPEWIQPPHYCACGKTSLHPFPVWLSGLRGCSLECAWRSRREAS